jgi:hypothetical protein
MWGFSWRGVFWASVGEALMGAARGRELEGARETAKRAAGIDAGEMGRDASGWSGSGPCCPVRLTVAGLNPTRMIL